MTHSALIFRFQGGRLFPSLSLVYFFASAAVVFISLLFIDRILIPQLEDSERFASASWKKEDEKIKGNNYFRSQSYTDDNVWRSPGFPVEKRKKTAHRILVVGDSFVWGTGLSNMNDIWWRQLQKELQRRGYNDVEVIAAGKFGMNTRDELEMTRQLIPQYAPDLVIFGYVVNDPIEYAHGRGTGFVKPVKPFPDPTFRCLVDAASSVFPNICFSVSAIRSRNLFGQDDFHDAWQLRVLEGENFKQYEKTVGELAQYFRSINTPCFFITLPVGLGDVNPKARIEPQGDFFAQMRSFYGRRYSPVEQLFTRNNLDFHNILEAYLKAIRDDDSIEPTTRPLQMAANPADGHPGPFATHAYATAAADILETEYSQTLGKKFYSGPAKPRINDWQPRSLCVVNGEEGAIDFVWPESQDELLSMPIRKPYVQLNLERAVALETISLAGEGLRRADAYVTCEDSRRHYDERKFLELGEKRGKQLKWFVKLDEQKLVSTIRIVANVNSRSPCMHLMLKVRGLTQSSVPVKKPTVVLGTLAGFSNRKE